MGSRDNNTINSLIKCSNIDNTLTNCNSMFSICVNLANTPIIPSSVTSCAYMFYGCTNLITVPQANIDLMQAVKNGTNTTCTSHGYCYSGCTNITTPQTYATLLSLYPNWITS